MEQPILTSTDMNHSPLKSNLAIASIVLAGLGLFGFFCGGCIGVTLFGLPAVITGLLALSEIKQRANPEETKNLQIMAMTGVIVGAVEIIVGLVVTILAFALVGGSWLLPYLDQLK